MNNKMKIPSKFLGSKRRKEMWKDASEIVKKLDQELNFSQIYIVGSFISKKKRPADIDFTVVAKLKHKKAAWPMDIVLVPEGDKMDFYLNDINKWVKTRYKSKCGMIKLK